MKMALALVITFLGFKVCFWGWAEILQKYFKYGTLHKA